MGIFIKRLVAAMLLAVVGWGQLALAVDTTSSIQGRVINDAGLAISGASITLMDTRTGSKKVVQSSKSGGFNVKGLKVGGPYTVTIADSDPGKAKEFTDIFLTLGKAYKRDFSLAVESEIEEIVILGVSNKALRSEGAMNSDDIENSPAVGREIHDLVKSNSMVSIDPGRDNSISIAGSNTRLNSVTVDGVSQNDDFGLRQGGFPTHRSPVSFDVIEQLSVEAAPMSVENNGFTGGTINMVTKSGSNEFTGSVFYDFRSDALTGDSLDGQDVDLDFDEQTFGMTFGGPIIEDKLFFFLGYEEFGSTESIDVGPTGGAYTNEVDGVSLADMDRIREIGQRVYDYDVGDFRKLDNLNEIEDKKIFVKLDWEINDYNRAVYTYQNNSGNLPTAENTDTATRDLAAPSHWWNSDVDMESHSLKVFSDWTDDFSTELSLAQKETSDTPASLLHPSFFTSASEIILDSGASVWVGTDGARHSNRVKADSWYGEFKASYYFNDHHFTAGIRHEKFDVFNAFIFSSRGSYTFNSINDFENRSPFSYLYINSVNNDPAEIAAEFENEIDSIYLQDEWDVNDRLSLLFGVRYERYSSDSLPNENALFQERYGFSNQQNLDGKDIFLPRLGFTYDLGDRTTLRGGYGVFSGGSPGVWLAGAYLNDGATQDSVFTAPFLDPGLLPSGDDVDFFSVPANVQAELASKNPNGNAEWIDPDFELPSIEKFNFAVDHEFGDGYYVTAEALFTQSEDSITWLHAGLEETSRAPDGRPIYSNIGVPADNEVKRDLGVTNASGGESTILTVSLTKDFENGIGVFASYTNSDVTDVNPGGSATYSSGYGRVATANYQNLKEATSNYQREHRFVFNFSYSSTELFEGYASRFGLLFSTQSGAPYSYTFGGSDAFGDDPGSSEDRQLFYVPTGANDPLLTAGTYTAELDAVISGSELDNYRGRIAPRNAFETDWFTSIDLKFSQEFPGFSENQRGVVTLDIENFGNMLNDDWGRYEAYPYHYVVPVADVAIDPATNTYTYSDVRDLAEPDVDTLTSLWKVRLGIRYEF